ncbi:MAG: hypothetical protein KC503_44895 [Myxococcales bacterium]|nr:hypothetical protein [Myxococcales bacterium]
MPKPLSAMSTFVFLLVVSACGAGRIGDPMSSSRTPTADPSEPALQPDSGDAIANSAADAAPAAADSGPSCGPSALSQLFAQRIQPLVKQGAPSSCNSCHLAGIDLSIFVQPTACASMACLVQKGLVDLEAPEASRILGFISQGKPASALITNAVRQKEYQGFLDWIRYSKTCQASVCGEIADPCGGGASGATPAPTPTPMLGGCSEAALLSAFEQKVNNWRGRCESCHAPNGAGKTKGPLWLPSQAADASTAMYNLIGLGAVNLKTPAASPLLTKPLDEAVGGVQHGGGPKIKSKGEQTYIDFLDWVTRYAACFGSPP